MYRGKIEGILHPCLSVLALLVGVILFKKKEKKSKVFNRGFSFVEWRSSHQQQTKINFEKSKNKTFYPH